MKKGCTINMKKLNQYMRKAIIAQFMENGNMSVFAEEIAKKLKEKTDIEFIPSANRTSIALTSTTYKNVSNNTVISAITEAVISCIEQDEDFETDLIEGYGFSYDGSMITDDLVRDCIDLSVSGKYIQFDFDI